MFIQQICIEGSLWARNLASYWRGDGKQNTQSLPLQAYNLVKEKDINQIIMQIDLPTGMMTIKEGKNCFESLWGRNLICQGSIPQGSADGAEGWSRKS